MVLLRNEISFQGQSYSFSQIGEAEVKPNLSESLVRVNGERSSI